MTLGRARVIRGAFPARSDARPAGPTARRIPGEVLDARAEASRLLERAQAEAAALVATAGAEAAARARADEVARLAAGFLELRAAEERRTERDRDRLVEIAVVLAERLIGEAIRVEPARVAELAAAAIAEARGARRVRIDACPEDLPAVRTALGAIEPVTDVQADATLPRGSLVVHTELGRVDARLEPQLARLAAALREALG